MEVPQTVHPTGAILHFLKHLTIHRVSGLFVNLTLHFLVFSYMCFILVKQNILSNTKLIYLPVFHLCEGIKKPKQLVWT